MVWYNPFTWFQQTTAAILADFHSIVAKLEGHATAQEAKMNVSLSKAIAHTDAAAVAEQEVKTATAIAAQVRALVTPQPDPRTEPGDVGATRG